MSHEYFSKEYEPCSNSASWLIADRNIVCSLLCSPNRLASGTEGNARTNVIQQDWFLLIFVWREQRATAWRHGDLDWRLCLNNVKKIPWVDTVMARIHSDPIGGRICLACSSWGRGHLPSLEPRTRLICFTDSAFPSVAVQVCVNGRVEEVLVQSFLPSSDRSVISRVLIDVDVDGAGVAGGVLVARRWKSRSPLSLYRLFSAQRAISCWISVMCILVNKSL